MYEKIQPLAKVIFTGLSVGNNIIRIDSLYNGHKLLEHPMEQTASLTFNYNDKLLAFQFTTCDLLNADKVKYVYKVEGFNDQWLPAQGNKIEFTSLAPGNYRFFIKACNSDGVWNEEATMLDITVKPPFYLSVWALILYSLLFISLIIFIIYRTRKNHNTKLERQKIQLQHEQEANLIEMKLRFFTNISHDLRTPLTLITTPLQTILTGVLEDGLRKKLNTINKNAEQLLQLINSLLDFRKLDVGAETLHLQTGDFVSFINEACKPFHVYAIDRRINFSFSHEMESISIQFDPDKVNKILSNLLSNAFKYTPDAGSIEVHIYQSDKYVCVGVSDSGQGINETEKKLIFERFYQASQNQNKTGSGIGLHIVREYVLMHKGIISVEDNMPQGSIFTFKLPVLEIRNIEELNAEKETGDELFEIEENQNVPVNPVLLFVDDNTDFCDFMADSLSDEYTVIVANNGQEAIDLLDRNDINVVVSDVMMPVMSGTELCNRIKTNIHWSHIPVILLTARAAEEYKIEGLEMGADDYITKPFNFNLLKLRIRKFLEWTEKCHLSFSQKMDVTPNEITITPLDEKLIEKAIKVVEEHIGESEFSVEELGASVGLSRSHLYKKLMFITGKGPAEFIRTIRLKRGRQLLEKSQLQIAEIAYEVGFNSPKRFTINFKHEFGVSPSEYLRGLK
jgi:signal transduction histidine kinase/DNA-binding response OmpR family regulator